MTLQIFTSYNPMKREIGDTVCSEVVDTLTKGEAGLLLHE